MFFILCAVNRSINAIDTNLGLMTISDGFRASLCSIDGQELYRVPYNDEFHYDSFFVEGVWKVLGNNSEGRRRYGYLNLNGQWAIEPNYIVAESFHHGLAFCVDEDGYDCYINHEGNTVWKSNKSKDVSEQTNTLNLTGLWMKDGEIIFVDEWSGGPSLDTLEANYERVADDVQKIEYSGHYMDSKGLNHFIRLLADGTYEMLDENSDGGRVNKVYTMGETEELTDGERSMELRDGQLHLVENAQIIYKARNSYLPFEERDEVFYSPDFSMDLTSVPWPGEFSLNNDGTWDYDNVMIHWAPATREGDTISFCTMGGLSFRLTVDDENHSLIGTYLKETVYDTYPARNVEVLLANGVSSEREYEYEHVCFENPYEDVWEGICNGWLGSIRMGMTRSYLEYNYGEWMGWGEFSDEPTEYDKYYGPMYSDDPRVMNDFVYFMGTHDGRDYVSGITTSVFDFNGIHPGVTPDEVESILEEPYDRGVRMDRGDSAILPYSGTYLVYVGEERVLDYYGQVMTTFYFDSDDHLYRISMTMCY